MKKRIELFDLHLLAESVAGEPTFAALGPATRQAVSMSSVKNDLRRAKEMLSACKDAQQKIVANSKLGKEPSRADGAVIQALLMQAIILYTRATHSKGKGRNKLQITNHLSVAGRAKHDQITTLRDRYLAHFSEPGNWERYRAVLALDLAESQMALSYPHESYYVRAEEAGALESLLSEAEGIAEAAYAKASERLNLVIKGLFENYPDLLDRLRQAPFDPGSFFEPDEIEGYLEGIGSLDPDPPTSPRIIVPPRM